MIKGLKAPKNFDLHVYAVGKLAKDVDDAFCRYFQVPKVYYYLESCRTHRVVANDGLTHPTRRNPSNTEVCACERHRLVWHGDGILGFIRRAQRYYKKYSDAPVLFVTPLRTKGKIQKLRDEYDRLWTLEDRSYWIVRNYAVYEGFDPVIYQRLYAQKQYWFLQADEAQKAVDAVEYWIGDVSSDGHMICGDDMWCILWNEVAK